jgi:DNA helicase II / ATP-dependent DNA helicase PcrA
MDIENLLNELNPAQKEAVVTLTGPLLVLAGAGSGKTRMLTYRVVNLILSGEATPGQILAVTFTNKAAREMSARIESLLTRAGIPLHENLWISTFHSTCARILRNDIYHLGYQPFFVIYDDGDQLSLLKKICDDLNLNDKVFSPKAFRHQISQAKMLGLKPADVQKKAFLHFDETALEVYQIYEHEMKRANALDFDDLLMKTYDLLSQHPKVLERYRDTFRFILVDEYQDTNHIQYLIVKILSEKHRNLCVVGDEDQSIYSWRGADIKNILDFEKDFAETKIVKLEENYRSTRNIVEAASKVIAKNSQRKDKKLFTINEPGSKITIQSENNEYDEARFVVRQTQDLLSNRGYSLNDIAVFYRTNAQSRVLEEQMRSYSIPYRLIGSVKFYERKEIKDVICYMRLLLNPTDDVAFYRIVNTPTRGIGKSTMDEVLRYSLKHKTPAVEAAQKVAEERLVHAGACNKLQNFSHLITKLRAFVATQTPSEIYLRILEDTQYAQKLREENTPESLARIENLEEFQNAILQFEDERGTEATMAAFLEEMALISDADKDTGQTEAVTLMTLHLSKGLEFKNVFVVGLEEGLFPSGKSLDEGDPHRLEEERRLFYVGMTRARENLYLTFARSRRVYGQEETRPASQFLGDIPEEFIQSNTRVKRPAFLDRFAAKFGSPSAATPAAKPEAFPNYERDDFGENSFADETDVGSADYKRGQRVRHPIFGVGSIFQVEGSGDQQKVSVLFSDKSLKKFMVKHARLQIVG